MRASGVQLINTSLPVSGLSEPVSIPNGFQGTLVASARSGLDPLLNTLSVNLRMGGVNGSGYVVAHSSKVITQNCMLNGLNFPAGEYVVRSAAGGSSIVGLYIGLIPTP